MTDNCTLRRYTKDDRTRVFHLIEPVWGELFAGTLRKIWEWKIENTFVNRVEGTKTLVLEHDDAIVGLLSMMAVPLKVRDKVISAFWMGDLVTYPRHRGRGTKLLKEIKKEPSVILGAPNELSYPLFKKLGWFDIYSLVNRVCVINMGNLLRRRIRNKAIEAIVQLLWLGIRRIAFPVPQLSKFKSLSIIRVPVFDTRIDEFWHDVAHDYGIIVVRDRQYLNWRFVERPDRKYQIYLAMQAGKIRGYISLSSQEWAGLRFGNIVDLLVGRGDRESLDALLVKAVKELELSGVDLITCYISPYDAFYQKALKKNGFLFKTIKGKVIAYSNSTEVSKEELMNAKNWFLTRGDSDLEMN